jgi:predicted alpha/beta-fold hydrolase
VQRLEVALEDGSGDRLVAALHLPEETGERPLVLLIHGISGCETSCYILLAATYFLARGYPVLRINLRGAGPSRKLDRRLGETIEELWEDFRKTQYVKQIPQK